MNPVLEPSDAPTIPPINTRRLAQDDTGLALILKKQKREAAIDGFF